VRLPAIDKTPGFKQINLTVFPYERRSCLGSNCFTFLNIEYDFGERINWEWLEYGRLWTYKLNYFEYLNQREMDTKTGLRLMREFSGEIDKSSVGLEPYPISLRGINWIKFMVNHDVYPDDVIQSLYAQYSVLTKKIEYHLLGNHLLENGFSVFTAGIFFDNEEFLKLAEGLLSAELDEQILPDGGHVEGSPMYQQILTQRILDCINFASNGRYEGNLKEKLKDNAERMLGWLVAMTFKNGEIPHFNDSAENISLSTNKLIEYAVRLGIKPIEITLQESGYRKFTAGNFEIVIDAGEIKPDYQAGHSHNDAGSFVLNVNNKPLIVDTGITTYQSNKRRIEERSVKSHNTVYPEGIEPSDIWGSFRVGKREKVRILKETKNSIEIERRLPNPAKVDLKRCLNLSENEIKISDRSVSDRQSKRYITSFHFESGCKIKKVSDHYLINGLRFSFVGAEEVKVENYKLAKGFNTQKDSKKLVITFFEELTTCIQIKN